MKSNNLSRRMSVAFLMSLFCLFGMMTLNAQSPGPGVDPTAIMLLDFEDGDVSKWTTSGIGRGEKVSVELMDAQNGDNVRFGRYAVKLNWDLTAAEQNTTISCIFSPPGDSYVIPATSGLSQRKIGMWIYASPECQGNIWFRLQQFTPPGSTPGAGAGYITVFGNEISYNNYWTGWKYHEFIIPAAHTNKEMGPPSKSTPSYGMFRLLQEKSGVAHQLTKGYFIIDNIRVTTGAEDVTRPTISAFTGNGAGLDGATIQTGVINLSATYSDAGGSNMNPASVCFVVNGVMYKTGDSQFAADATTATLTGLKLRNGTHTVVVHVEDNFGNIQENTATFTVNDPNEVATEVTLVTDDKADVGNVFEMKVNTSNSTDVKKLNMTMELNEYASVAATGGVVFAPSVTDGTYTYNPVNHQLTISLDNDHTVADVKTLATIKVDISKNSNPDDVIRVAPISATATYGDDSSDAFSLFTAFSKPVLATYNLAVVKRIVGANGEVLITDLSGNPVSGVTVYGGSASGVTGADGVASFNFANEAQELNMYAGKDGKYSYTYVVRTLVARLDKIPSAIRSGTTVDPSTSKTFTWMANPVTAAEPSIIKIAKKADGEASFVQHNGESQIFEFTATAASGATKGSRVTVTGLEPGTDYIYQLGDGVNWTATREFTTTRNTDKFTFSAYGDLQATGPNDMTHWYAAAAKLEALPTKPFFSLNVGDIVDNDSRWDYHAYYSSLFDKYPGFANIDMTAGYGNHEYMGTANADIIKFLNGHQTLEPSANYNIDIVGDGTYASVYGNMLVIGLDWESKGNGFTALQRQTEQVKWLEEVLTAHADKVWKVISIHYEIPNASFTPTSLATLGPVLDKHNVQIAFCGHGHTFRRVQIKNNVWTPSTYTRTAAPVQNAGTLHWQMGGMRPSDGNSQRWVMGEVDGNTIKFTVRNGNNEVVANESFTLTTAVEEYPVTFTVDAGNGTLEAMANGESIITGAQVQKGKEVVFTATPKVGFKVKSWKLDGAIVTMPTDPTKLVVASVTKATTVSVEFDAGTGLEESLNTDITMSPNPFVDVVSISGSDKADLQVLDVAGVVVHSQKIENDKESIQLGKLLPGIYFFHLTKDGQTKVIKAIKK